MGLSSNLNVVKEISLESQSSSLTLLKAKLKDYGVLMKFKLNLTVVFTALMGFLFATGMSFDWSSMLLLALGGFLVTGSSNTINQILEKDFDKLMKRTKDRPLAARRMGVPEAVLLAGVTGVAGLGILAIAFNPLSAFIGALALLSYAFIYTPLKRFSPIAVFVGAIPGALPPVIGWVAATGEIGMIGYMLFSIQFLWQFPHFWAIGWIGYDDYRKAGYKLLPTADGKGKRTAFHIIVYTVFLTMVSLLPYFFGAVGMLSMIVFLLGGLMMLYYGVKLFREATDKAALKVMFASIVYLPIVQIFMVLDKI